MSHVAPTDLFDVTDDRITPSDQNHAQLHDHPWLDGADCSESRRSDDGLSDVNDRPRRCGDDTSDSSMSVVRGRDDAEDGDGGGEVFLSNTTTNTRQCCQCQLSDRQVPQSLRSVSVPWGGVRGGVGPCRPQTLCREKL